MNIIGLGSAGCAIADKFSQHAQYKIYKIDVGLKGNKKDGIFAMPKQNTPAEYESKSPSLNNFFKEVSGEVYFFIAGSGDISACSLRVLEHIKDCKINIVYVKPDVPLLNGSKKLMENLIFRVFQEYARSGLFEKMYIVSNPHIEAIIGDVPIAKYYDKINELLVSTMHMINVYNHSEPIQSHFVDNNEISRICTLGIYDIDKSEEKLFFPLDKAKNKYYIYAINEETLESDGSLFRKIMEQTKETIRTQKVNINFNIYSTEYEHNYSYIMASSHIIQE